MIEKVIFSLFLIRVLFWTTIFSGMQATATVLNKTPLKGNAQFRFVCHILEFQTLIVVQVSICNAQNRSEATCLVAIT